MFKTFLLGVVLGIAAVGGVLYTVPMVDQGRERSLISVQANGGNTESFHVNLPGDRIFAGKSGAAAAVMPATVEWPEFMADKNTQAELFKVRNAEDKVIGIASRFAVGGDSAFVEWAVHMPARGTLYLALDQRPNAAGHRDGGLRGGTREFAELKGSVVERFEAAGGGGGGRLELVTALVGPDEPIPEPEVNW
ncbi:MAG: hypothetical protein AAF417_01830 [Pseudomonadota bacterium]